MNILLTNDDGIFSEGIQILKKELEKLHNVYLIAPSSEKSATSHAISLTKTMIANKISKREYSIDGFPADCVNIGIHSQLWKDTKFDLIISGINKGLNLGTDVIYSGTVAGSRQGFIHGISGIAISTKFAELINFQEVAIFVQKFIHKIEHKFLSNSKIFYNINYPQNRHNKTPRVFWTQLGKRIYEDGYRIKKKNESEYLIDIKLSPMGYQKEDSQYLTDFEAFDKNAISITPIQLDTTDYNQLSTLVPEFTF